MPYKLNNLDERKELIKALDHYYTTSKEKDIIHQRLNELDNIDFKQQIAIKKADENKPLLIILPVMFMLVLFVLNTTLNDIYY